MVTSASRSVVMTMRMHRRLVHFLRRRLRQEVSSAITVAAFTGADPCLHPCSHNSAPFTLAAYPHIFRHFVVMRRCGQCHACKSGDKQH
jgi:hypothetical protein